MSWGVLIFLVVIVACAIRLLFGDGVSHVGGNKTTKEHTDKDRAKVGATAFAVSAFRAIESVRTDRPPLFIDPVSVALFSYLSSSPLSLKTKLFFKGAEWMYWGAMSTWLPVPFSWIQFTRIVKLVDLLALRTRFIDDHVIEPHKRNDINQLVIMGAGLDARGYRLNKFKGKIFEVDFAGMLKKKDKIFTKIGFPKPDNVCHVGTDFSLPTPIWDKDLESQGFDATQPSIWILEGLTSYLHPPELTSLFSTLSSCSAPGSKMVVTWIGIGEKKTDFAPTAKIDMHCFFLDNPDSLSRFSPLVEEWELDKGVSIGEVKEMYYEKDWKCGTTNDDRSYWFTCATRK